MSDAEKMNHLFCTPGHRCSYDYRCSNHRLLTEVLAERDMAWRTTYCEVLKAAIAKRIAAPKGSALEAVLDGVMAELLADKEQGDNYNGESLEQPSPLKVVSSTASDGTGEAPISGLDVFRHSSLETDSGK